LSLHSSFAIRVDSPAEQFFDEIKGRKLISLCRSRTTLCTHDESWIANV